MGWSGDYFDEWGFQGQSPVMYYLNYVLLIGCIAILVCALYFVFRECCQSNKGDEETEAIIMMQPSAQVPSYTELAYDRDQSHNHRIVHAYSRQSQVASSTGSQVAPHHYYAYDHKHLATYYMYPTPCNIAEGPSASTTATSPATAYFVQSNYGDCHPPPREDERPPPYAPNH